MMGDVNLLDYHLYQNTGYGLPNFFSLSRYKHSNGGTNIKGVEFKWKRCPLHNIAISPNCLRYHCLCLHRNIIVIEWICRWAGRSLSSMEAFGNGHVYSNSIFWYQIKKGIKSCPPISILYKINPNMQIAIYAIVLGHLWNSLNDNKTCRVVSYSNSYLQATFHSPVPPRDANKSDVVGLQGLKIYKMGWNSSDASQLLDSLLVYNVPCKIGSITERCMKIKMALLYTCCCGTLILTKNVLSRRRRCGVCSVM